MINSAIRRKIVISFQYLFVLVFSLVLFVIFKRMPLAAIILPCLLIYYFIAKKFDTKKFLWGFLFVYPLLPSIFGIAVGPLPVFKSHRIAVILLLGLLFTKGELGKFFKDFFKEKIFSKEIIFVCVSLFITSMISINPVKTTFFSLSFVFEFLVMAIVVFSVVQTDDDIEKFSKVMIVSTLVLCAMAIIERAVGTNLYNFLPAYNDDVSMLVTDQMRNGAIRVRSAFPHSIAFGAYLVSALAIFMAKFKNDNKKFALYAVPVLLTILLTQSRASMVGMIILFSMYLFSIGKKQISLIILGIILVVIFKYDAVMEAMIYLNPLTSKSTEMYNSTSARFDQFFIVGKEIMQKPFFGYGKAAAGVGSTDNFYLLYTFFFGFTGLCSYLILMVNVIIKPIKEFGKTIWDNHLLLCLIFACLAFYVINFVVALWAFHFIYWIYIGLIARLIVNERKRKEELNA